MSLIEWRTCYAWVVIQRDPPHHRGFKVLNFIQGGIKKVLKSLKFDLLKPADTLT